MSICPSLLRTSSIQFGGALRLSQLCVVADIHLPQSPMTAAAAAACPLLLSSPLTIFSMESSSLGLLVEGGEEGEEVGDLLGEADRGGDDGGPLEATLSNAEPPEVPIEADAVVGDSSGENLCRSLSAARGDGSAPAAP